MKKNKTVDTAKNGQTTKKIQPENVQKDLAKIAEIKAAKASKVPTGKITLIKETEARKKAREEQYKNFRVNALRRRCKRMKISDEDTEKYVKKLIEQINSPNTYHITISFNPNDIDLVKQALKNEDLVYSMIASSHLFMDGDGEVLATVRKIMPPSARIYPYAKKKESVLPKQTVQKEKKPTNNTKEKKSAASSATKIYGGSKRYAKRQKGRVKTLSEIRKASRFVKKNLKKGEKIDIKKVFKVAEGRKKRGTATTVQLKAKKSSTGSKKASTSIKKAA